MKIIYHPALILAYYLQCLPEEIREKIPRSTKFDWSKKQESTLFGYEWFCSNRELFDTIEKISVNKNLLKLNKALIKAIALSRFIVKYKGALNAGLASIKKITLIQIQKLTTVMQVSTVLKLLNMPYSLYLKIKNSYRCHHSVLALCSVKHPDQLLSKEVAAIKKYCLHEKYTLWPLSSVYYQLIKDGAGFFSLSTFYKYAAVLNLQRIKCNTRKKNHTKGIRTDAPLKLLHADVTVLRTADNLKAYIYLIQDNYSRAILGWRVSNQCKAALAFENLVKVYENYLRPSGISDCCLLTDNGGENFGPITEFVSQISLPSVQHLIAQVDVEFSNSMIEAANKQLKYRFLYHKHIADLNNLKKYVKDAVEDFNKRPHHVLNGLTPIEVLNGKPPDANLYKNEMIHSRMKRVVENKKISCCHFSF